MVKVMASGVFDLLHPGHVHYLTEAKSFGDELIVVVATDKTTREKKHEPINSQNIRLMMVQNLKQVNEALIGHDDDIYKIVVEIKPDIIALGHDQAHNAERIINDLKERGLDVKVVRCSELDYDLSGTRKIIRKVIDWYTFREKMKGIEGEIEI